MIRFSTRAFGLLVLLTVAMVGSAFLATQASPPALAQALQQVLTGGNAWTDGSSPSAATAGQPTRGLFTPEGVQAVTLDHPRRVSCRLTTSATTSTAITGCTAPGAGLSIYVTDISVYGGVATGATAAASLQYGTGGTCGTGTTIVYDCQHAATAGCEAHFSVPAKAVANSELCLVDATVGTKFISLKGYIAP